VVITRDGMATDHKPEKGNDVVATALHAHSAIVGIAADPRRHLPRDLMRAAEFHLVIGQIDAAALSLVIEAVTGAAPTIEIDPELIRAADVSDLQLALRRDRSADECLRRLSEVVKNRGLFDAAGPRLEELAGYGEARQWGLELAVDLAAYRRGELDWGAIEKGLLIAGPPGVGKTQFAKALAKTAGVPIVATSVADWNAATYLSGTLQAMRSAFAQARRLAPAILFIDEMDGISDRATLRGEYVEYWSQIVNLLLELLAGVEERPGVVVIGATNHPDRIDAAVRRAGRLDRTITIGLPEVKDLIGILKFHLKGALADVDLMPAALAARGRTGADVEAWVRRAKGKVRRGQRALSIDDLLAEIRNGQRPLSDGMRRKCAIHEAGHVVVGATTGMFTTNAVSIHDVGGVTAIELNKDHAQTLGGLEALITMLLGGRAAETAFFAPEEITVGAGVTDDSDLARATKIAIDIETRFGCGSFGIVRLSERILDLCLHDAQVIAPVKRRLDKCFARARDIITANHGLLLALSDPLGERGYLDQGEIDALLQRHPPQLKLSSESSGTSSEAGPLDSEPVGPERA
jgi:ATP-dependent Zn protease